MFWPKPPLPKALPDCWLLLFWPKPPKPPNDMMGVVSYRTGRLRIVLGEDVRAQRSRRNFRETDVSIASGQVAGESQLQRVEEKCPTELLSVPTGCIVDSREIEPTKKMVSR